MLLQSPGDEVLRLEARVIRSTRIVSPEWRPVNDNRALDDDEVGLRLKKVSANAGRRDQPPTNGQSPAVPEIASTHCPGDFWLSRAS